MDRNLLTIATPDKGHTLESIGKILDSMKEANAAIRWAGGSRGVVDELERDGQYNADYFFEEYGKITAKQSKLSRRKREFINEVCWNVIIKLAEEKK